MDEEAVLTKLRQPFTRDELEFVKYKLELILPGPGKGTPKQNQESGSRYTTLDRPVYDTGYRSGSADQLWFAGCHAADSTDSGKRGMW